MGVSSASGAHRRSPPRRLAVPPIPLSTRCRCANIQLGCAKIGGRGAGWAVGRDPLSFAREANTKRTAAGALDRQSFARHDRAAGWGRAGRPRGVGHRGDGEHGGRETRRSCEKKRLLWCGSSFHVIDLHLFFFDLDQQRGLMSYTSRSRIFCFLVSCRARVVVVVVLAMKKNGSVEKGGGVGSK